MKKLCIISHSKSVAQELKEQLTNVLGNYVQVTSWAMDIEKDLPDKADLYVASFLSVYREAESKLPDSVRMIRAKRFFNPIHFQKLLSIPAGTRVLIAANSRLSCAVSLRALHQFDITHISYVMHDPMHPVPESEGIRIALVAGKNKAIPEYVCDVIDIGVKDLAITTYMKIVQLLDIPVRVIDELVFKYVSRLFDITCKYYLSEKIMHSIVQGVDDGIFVINKDGFIDMSNKSASRLFPGTDIRKGQPVAKLFSGFSLPLPLQEGYSLCDKVVERNGQYYVINIETRKEKDIEAIVMVKPASRVQELDGIVRHELRHGSNRARHSFKDIITEDGYMHETMKLAERFANTRLAVLLEGESGVGKELFAHAIHTVSPQAQYPFVAINLAAMPESLIESELFGYIDGAFTGARKGGQRGLFEEAHKGTIFLDEVGDAPLSLQAKLLRVLETSEVRRVGSKSSIIIDVRVIAATNKNLIKMVREQTFRADLFFRLCACPLHITPLRKRKTDIFLLIKHFSKLIHGKFIDLEPELELFFAQYPWPGNVRELQNVVGYIANVLSGREPAGLRHLPQYLLQDIRLNQEDGMQDNSHNTFPNSLTGAEDGFSVWFTRLKAQKRDELSLLILCCLHEGWSGRATGRYSLLAALHERNHLFSPYELKACIGILRNAGFITIGKTRQGCSITLAGKNFLHYCRASN